MTFVDPPARHLGQKVLSMEQEMQLKELCDLGDDFVALCNKIGKTRDLSLAITNMEQAVHWATAHFLRQT